MTYIHNGPAWWQVLLLTIAGGVIALLARDGWAWLVEAWAGWRARHRGDPIQDATDDAAALVGTWTPPRRWAANGRYVHRVGCEHMTTGDLINVWTEDAARKWAEGASPRLTGCPHCTPFDAPERAEVTG